MSHILLLERLTDLEDPGLAGAQIPDRRVLESIARHLGSLLNTRAGSVPADPDYGLADMSNIAGSFASGTAQSIAEAMLLQIRRYEPRLRDCRISVQPESHDVIALRFELVAQLEGSQQAQSFILRLSPGGRVRVEPSRR